MTVNLNLKRGDSGIPFEDDANLVDEDGQPVDLTGATVLFLLKTPSGNTFSRVSSIDPVERLVHYTSVPEDFEDTGAYYQEWEVTTAGGEVATIPSDGYNRINVMPDLNP